ncbi:hypothetical protein PV516_19300 [Streptomyces scabiei]|uniref:hypothetical protein n=1 Tax=Streptomyces scabiei TaxID=1930 RepID=UPI0029A7AA28|nr:hypothetical protein [Streptomyces scabiei]MDX3165936.1 hypothetical protein [Streptomyces scabiei]
MTDTTNLATEEPDNEAPSATQVLEDLARMYLRTGASPLPLNPATLGWQSTARSLAALSARMLHFLNGIDPKYGAAFAAFYHGPIGDGPHPLGVGLWIERNIAKPASADITEWVAEAKQEAAAALTHTSRPTGLGELGILLGDDAIALLINGLGAGWKEWEEHGSTRRGCFLPGCTREFDLVKAWAGEGSAQTEGWMSSPAVGFCCPEHVTYLWAGDHQHLPAWTRPTSDSNAQLTCSCGWVSGGVRFRGHGTTLYGAHALEVITGVGTAGDDLGFLGMPPSSVSEQYMGRVTHIDHRVDATMAAGVLTLPSGVGVHWITHSESVRRHRDLFRPDERVIVTAHNVGGPQYLTGIRRATAQEWQNAVETLGSGPAASGLEAPEASA